MILYIINRLSLFTFLIFYVTVNFAQQPTQEWESRYSGPSSSGSRGVSIKADGSGSVYVLNNTSNSAAGDIGLLKYSANGTLLWQAIYEHPNGVNEGAIEMTLDNNGNIYVLGSIDSNLNFHIEIIKYNTNGILQWERFYNTGNENVPYDIAADNEGNVIVAGGSLSGGIASALLIKYNSIGDTLWVRKFNQLSSNNVNLKIVIDESNNVYTVGRTGGDYLILKYQPNGNFEWFATYNSPENYFDIGWHIALDENQNTYVIGTNAVPFQSTNNTLIKINGQGIVQWARTFIGIFGNGGGCQIPKGVVATPDGASIYYTTFCRNNTGGGGYDVVTLRYNSIGDSIWVRRFGGGVGATENEPAAIRLDLSNNVYVTGHAHFLTSGTDYFLLKYSSNGSQQWVATYSGVLATGDDFSRSLFINPTASNLYVTGTSRNEFNNGWVTATIKYSQPLGLSIITNEIPNEYILYQNYPNPFNPETNIRFDVTEKSNLRLLVYDILGRVVTELVNEEVSPGEYSVSWDASMYSSGMYIYRIVAGNFAATKKMLLLK